MQETLHKLIERYHGATIVAAQQSHDLDQAAIAAATHRDVDGRHDTIALWIRKYGVSRVAGLTIDDDYTPFAKAMADAAVAYFDRESFDDGTPRSVMRHFAHLRAVFGDVYRKGGGKGDRKLQSLTSKVLWLRMPEEAPIFDGQAETAIIFLVKLLKAQRWAQNYETGDEGTCNIIDGKWGWTPHGTLSREALDNCWYQDFLHSHGCVYGMCHGEIERRLDAEGRTWLKPFRYFDKLLWILGDEGRDYSLMRKADDAFKRFAGPQPGSNESVA